MGLVRSVGNFMRRATGRRLSSVNSYRVLRVSVFASDEAIDHSYYEGKRIKGESYWLREAEFAREVLMDPDKREEHDRALKQKFGLEDLFLFEIRGSALDFFNLRPSEVRIVNMAPGLRVGDSELTNIVYSDEVRDELYSACVGPLKFGLRENIHELYPDALFAVVNSNVTILPNPSLGKRYEYLVAMMSCAWNAYAYSPPPITFTLNKG